MTTVRPSPRRSTFRPFSVSGVYGDELGPFATFCGQALVFLGLMVAFSPIQNLKGFPGRSGQMLMICAIGLLLLAPKNALKRIPVSVSLVAFIGVMVMSILWTINPEGTLYDIERVIPLVVTFWIAAGLLRLEDLTVALIWSIRVALAFTLVVVGLNLEGTRVHLDDEQFGATDGELPGWHGFYTHKNVMAPFFSFAAVTVLLFDRNQLYKWMTLGGLGFMVVMSTSRTGLFAFAMMIGVYLWLKRFSELDERNGVVFFMSTAGLGLFGLVGAYLSVSTLVRASGKDQTFTGRTDIWSAVLEVVMERPWLGYGGNGLFWSEPLTSNTAAIWRDIGFEAQHPHQGLLDVIVQYGIIGLVIYGGFFFSTWSSAWGLMRTNRVVSLWILSVMAGQLFMSLSENVLLGDWLYLVVIFRIISLRRFGMDFPESGSRPGSGWSVPAQIRSRSGLAGA